MGKNWRGNDFPVDLWVKHSEKLFDEISIATHCDRFDFKYGKNVRITHIEDDPNVHGTYRYYVDPLMVAQKELNTDWKVLMPVDEFLTKRINPEELDKRYAYAAKIRQFYGNLETELTTTGFPVYQWRIHYGNRRVIKDGGDVEPPYFAKMSPARLAGLAVEEVQRLMFNAAPKVKKVAAKKYVVHTPLSYRIYAGLCDASRAKHFTVWHTGYARNPKSLMIKWREDIERVANSGHALNKGMVEVLKRGNVISYNNAYKYVWRGSALHRLNKKEVPKVLLENKKRFTWASFDREYAS
ncbi:MAG: hypothetical protein KGH57_00100 [Candidatus Micrarchaeota archaeon]|nr:hypothetical protein [Candidatus Micrarchaeota archaeon]